MKDGRRWYFNFIYTMIQNDPESKWDALMAEQFGANERATRYFELLKTGKTLEKLKQKGIFTFDSDMDLGVAGYDAAMLVGQARIAYTGNIISEEEAWKVIKFARELAVNSFTNWEDFGKSFALGFDLDMRADYDEYKEDIFHLFKQVMDKPDSPWNTINWLQ